MVDQSEIDLSGADIHSSVYNIEEEKSKQNSESSIDRAPTAAGVTVRNVEQSRMIESGSIHSETFSAFRSGSRES